MKDNTVNANGIEVYENGIKMYADEYIQKLSPDVDEIRVLIRKSQTFKGMLKYIYINLFKPDKNIKSYDGIRRNSNINYGDIDLLNSIWDIYTELCYKYLQCPTILNFSLLTGIDMTTFNSWDRGETRAQWGADGEKVTSLHSQSYKKWKSECEAAAYDSALSGNPGAMFILKSNYGYTEQPQRIEVVESGARPTLEQIRERYRSQQEFLEAPPKELKID